MIEDVRPAPVLVAARRRLRQPGMQRVAELVLRRRRRAVVRLELTDDEAIGIGPEVRGVRPQRLRRHRADERGQRLVIGLRDGDVAGQVVIRHAAVGAPLDVGVTAQRVEPAAGPPDVAEQQLQHRRGVNQLHRVAVMRPAERIHDRADAIGRMGRGDELRRLHEVVGAAAADVRDRVRRVARIEALHHLEHRSRMRERGIDLREPLLVELVVPARLVRVRLLLVVPSGKHAALLVEGVLFRDQERRVGEQADVLVVIAVVGQGVVDQPAEERDVGAGADLDEAIGDRRRAIESRIDAHQLRVAVPPRLHDEAEPDRVVLSRIAAHGEDDVRVADVGPAIGHRSASERGGQTGHRRPVSYPGLLLDRHHAEPGAEGLHEEIVQFVGIGAAADHADRGQRVDRAALRRPSPAASRRGSSSATARCDRWPSPRTCLPTRVLPGAR